MNSTDIENIVNGDQRASKTFRGVYPKDELLSLLANSANINGSFVFNTHPSLKGGEHWICLVVDDGAAIYFDSFGRHPLVYSSVGAILAQRRDVVLYNSQLLQNVSTTVCGDYCVLFLLLRSRGWTLQRYVDWLYQLGDSEGRDHALRRLTLTLFGWRSFSCYRNYPLALTGDDLVHIELISASLGRPCVFRDARA